MPISRRNALIAVALLSGCTASPVVGGTPGSAPSSPQPSRSPESAAAALAVAELSIVLERDITAPAAWRAAAVKQCKALLSRLELLDPTDPESTAFPPAEPSPTRSREQQITASLKALDAAAAAAPRGDHRLVYASASVAALGLKANLVPRPTDEVPVPLAEITPAAARKLALSHVWALVYGLGVGLGRIPASTELHKLGTARLAAVKLLRNELLDVAGTEQFQQPAAFNLPNKMTEQNEIKVGWTQLESNLLGGLGALVAASDDQQWRIKMRAQVTPIQQLGGNLGSWPGWVAS